jgi:hypothetical protein
MDLSKIVRFTPNNFGFTKIIGITVKRDINPSNYWPNCAWVGPKMVDIQDTAIHWLLCWGMYFKANPCYMNESLPTSLPAKNPVARLVFSKIWWATLRIPIKLPCEQGNYNYQ